MGVLALRMPDIAAAPMMGLAGTGTAVWVGFKGTLMTLQEIKGRDLGACM